MALEVPGREFLFTEKEFQRIRRLIYEHAGINLSDAKKDMVYSRLGRRLRANNLKTFAEYLAILEGNNETEWEAFVNSLTTNLTAFFREAHHFPILAEHIGSIKNRRPIKLWCSASSTGEEPYTMAMTMMDLFGSMTPPVHILATDLDTNVLRKAQAGVYPQDRVEKLSPSVLKRFFLKGTGHNEGQVQIRQELRDMVTFGRLNLLDEKWSLNGPFDAIFCRNVMIYFDKQTQYKILKKFIPVMHKDALLFAGHSESFQNASDLFNIRTKTVYRIAEASRHLAVIPK